MAKKKEQKPKEDPKYMKLCENSASCSAERSTKVLSDMTVTSCTQCFHVLSWEKISIDKKSDAPKSKAGKSEEKAPEQKPKASTTVVKMEAPKSDLETIAEESPNIHIVKPSPEVETDTDKDAAKLREVFAGVDSIMESVEKGAVKQASEEPETAVAVDDDFDPFAEPEPVKTEPKIGYFKIESIRRKETNVIRFIMFNSDETAKFILDKETEPAKAEAVEKRPESVVGKYMKAEFTALNDKLCPVDPVYIAVAVKPD